MIRILLLLLHNNDEDDDDEKKRIYFFVAFVTVCRDKICFSGMRAQRVYLFGENVCGRVEVKGIS